VEMCVVCVFELWLDVGRAILNFQLQNLYYSLLHFSGIILSFVCRYICTFVSVGTLHISVYVCVNV
jgi:hypothetical protein